MDYKCHSCDKPMREDDFNHDRDWCLECWKEHLDGVIYQAKMKLKVVEERLNEKNIRLT